MLFNDAVHRLDYVASVAVVEWYQQGKSKVFEKKLLSDICPTLTSTWIGLELNPALRCEGRRLSWAMAHLFFTVM